MANLAYVSDRYIPEDKTTEVEKRNNAWKAILLQNRKQMPETQSYRRRSDIINQGGLDATLYETRQRNARQQAWMQQQQNAMNNQGARQVGVNLPGGTSSGGGAVVPGGSSFEKFVAAITGQESGGNYGARNGSSGAMGRYQIMPGNIAGSGRGWDYEALGRDISTSQFMGDPKLQDAIARYKLQQYFNKWGPRGAAIAWYAGPGAVGRVGGNKSQGAYPTINQYANSILRRMGLG